jgi:uncharacterized sulfatase
MPKGLLWGFCLLACQTQADDRPNVLVVISDDQSYPHASAYGYEAIETPAFDRVARAGVLFHNAFTPAPGCSPMRAALLTGRNIWQLEHAGTHASSFPSKYTVYQDRLEAAGYLVGFTGKGWGPGNWEASGRLRNPAGPEYSAQKLAAPAGIRNIDYAANFAQFLDKRTQGQPFSFWFGAGEPHRKFGQGIGRAHGLERAKVWVPPFLPDTPEVRDDMLDYCYEIQWFDQHLGRMLDALEAIRELDNTLVIVTSDNGMAFPRAKANLYEYGIHMPLAVAWPAKIPAGRKSAALVNLIDLTPTIYEVTGVESPSDFPVAGQSMADLLMSAQRGDAERSREAIYAGRERHSSSRFNTLGYPARCIRTHEFLYVLNLRPERWPAGGPQVLAHVANPEDPSPQGPGTAKLGPLHGGYHDIDACPTLSLLIKKRALPEIGRYLGLAVDKRPAEELFDIRVDPGCLVNLAENRAYATQKKALHDRLMQYLTETHDPRVTSSDGGDIWETYPRYSPLRWFPTPAWAKKDPSRVPKQDWLERKRPAWVNMDAAAVR